MGNHGAGHRTGPSDTDRPRHSGARLVRFGHGGLSATVKEADEMPDHEGAIYWSVSLTT